MSSLLPPLSTLPALPGLGGALSPRPRRRRAAPLDPTEEEERDWLGKTLAGVSWLGETLDKPGAAVRGTLSGLTGGEWGGGLLNLVPFSDTLGLTQPEERVYGSDLLQQWGVAPADEQPGFQMGSPSDWGRAVGGFATDVALDPLTWIGLGLATKAGKAASTAAGKAVAEAGKDFGKVAKMSAKGAGLGKAGLPGTLEPAAELMPHTLSEGLRASTVPVARLHWPWLPFVKGAGETITVGGKPLELTAKSNLFGLPVGKWAAETVAKANDIIASNPLSPIRYMRGLLSPNATAALDATHRGGRVTLEDASQILNDYYSTTRKQLEAGVTNMKVASANAKRSLNSLYDDILGHGYATDNPYIVQEFTRRIAESGMPDPADFDRLFATHFSRGGPANLTGLQQKLGEVVDGVRIIKNARADALRKYGVNIGELHDDYIQHVHRQSSAAGLFKEIGRTSERLRGIQALSDPTITRDEILSNIPFGSYTINQAARNPRAMKFEAVADGPWRKLDGNEYLADLQSWAKDKAADATKLGNKKAADLYNKLASSQDTDAMEVLRKAYWEDEIIRPALDEAWAKNAGAITLDPTKRTAEYERWLGKGSNATDDLIEKLDSLSPENFRKAVDNASKGLSKQQQDILANLKDRMGNGIWERGVFDADVLDDLTSYLDYTAIREADVYSLHNFLGGKGAAKWGLQGKGPVQLAKDHQEWASLSRVWRDAKFTDDGLATFVENNAAQLGIDPTQLAKVQKAVADGGGPGLGKAIDDLDLRIAPDAQNAVRQYQLASKPQVANALTKVVDRYLSLVKHGLYSLWPASHIRDFGSDFWQAASHGYVPLWRRDGTGLIKGYKDAIAYLGKGTGKNVPADVERLLQEFADTDTLQSFAVLDITNSPHLARKLRGENLPEKGAGIWASLFKDTKDVKAGAKLWNMPGMRSAEFIESGGKLGWAGTIPNNVQNVKAFLTQGGYYIALRREGFSQGKAATLIKEAFFTEREASSFVRGIARRAVPFWRFSSHNIPFQIKKIFQEPGGVAAQSARLLTETAGEVQPDVYTPEFLAETQAIPMGGEPEAQTFYINPGLIPLSDFNNLVFRRGGLPKVGRSLGKFAAMLSPPILAPVEITANKQVWSGRPLSDLQSTTEIFTGKEIPALDRLIHYLPLSRLAGTGAQLVDERKTWGQVAANLLGAGRMTTYNTEEAKLRDLRDAYAKMLKAEPKVKQWVNYFVSESDKERMRPEDVEYLQSLSKRREQLTKLLSQKVKSRKSQKESSKK